MTKDFDREVIVKYNLLNLPIVTQLSQKIISTTSKHWIMGRGCMTQQSEDGMLWIHWRKIS